MNDYNEQSGEEYSPERNEDGSYNTARECALENNARRVYNEGTEGDEA